MRVAKKMLVTDSFNARTNLEDFLAPTEDGGLEFTGPLWNPARILMNFVNSAFALVVPIIYGLIFKFRRAHAVTSLGSIFSVKGPL